MELVFGGLFFVWILLWFSCFTKKRKPFILEICKETALHFMKLSSSIPSWHMAYLWMACFLLRVSLHKIFTCFYSTRQGTWIDRAQVSTSLSIFYYIFPLVFHLVLQLNIFGVTPCHVSLWQDLRKTYIFFF